MDNIFINIFNNVSDQDTSKKLSVLDVIQKISEGEWESQINMYRFEPDKKRKEFLKKNLPAVTFSGTLSGKGRLDTNIDNYTKIVVCDIDKIPPGKLSQYKKNLALDNYVIAYFESPSKGLKVLIQVDTELKYHNPHAFIQIEDYMKKHYNIIIDPSGKNPSRLCFISHDPNMHYNDSYDVFPVDATIDYEALEISSTMESVKHINKNFESSSDSRYVFDTICEWISNSKTGAYHKGNRNNFIFSLACRLSESGMNQETTLGMAFTRYPSLGIREMKSTIRSAYKHTNSTYGSNPVRVPKSNQENIF